MSSDPKLRHTNLQTIITHLSDPHTRPLTHLQSLQLWTALFYSLYMHDSPTLASSRSATTTLQALTTTMTSSLLETVTATAKVETGGKEKEKGKAETVPRQGLVLTAGFWETISVQWGAVDRLRMEKVLLLVRGMVRAVFWLVAVSVGMSDDDDENKGVVPGAAEGREQVEILARWPMSSGRGGGSGEGRKVPDGLRYHCLDVWIDELERTFRDEERKAAGMEDQAEHAGRGSRKRKEKQKAVLDLVMPLVETMAKEALTKGVRLRAKETLADERLSDWQYKEK
jgi:ribosomal RNA-processing protein 1